MDDDESSNILPNERTCPKLKEVMDAYSNSEVVRGIKKEYDEQLLPELETIFRRWNAPTSWVNNKTKPSSDPSEDAWRLTVMGQSLKSGGWAVGGVADCVFSHVCPNLDIVNAKAWLEGTPKEFQWSPPASKQNQDRSSLRTSASGAQSEYLSKFLRFVQKPMFAMDYASRFFGNDTRMVSDLAKYRAGPLIGEALATAFGSLSKESESTTDSDTQTTSETDDKKKKDDKTFFLFSGHDTGPMSTLLGAMQAELEEHELWPSFASHISIELGDGDTESSSENAKARILYNGRPIGNAWCNDVEKMGLGVCSQKSLMKKLTELVPSRKECFGVDASSETRNSVESENASSEPVGASEKNKNDFELFDGVAPIIS